MKSSWRKAVEEDEAQRNSPSAELNNDLTGRLSPIGQQLNLSPDAPSQTASCTSAPTPADRDASSFCQQAVVPKSSLLWDTFSTEAHDSPSGTGSSAVQFSLDHETLPEMPSSDSLNLEDEAVDMTSEDDEVLIPSLKTRFKETLLTSPHEASRKVCPIDGPGTPLSDCRVSSMETSWLIKPASPDEKKQVFSLDLDSLDSSPKKQEFSLPTLITFSPIDDMKC